MINETRIRELEITVNELKARPDSLLGSARELGDSDTELLPAAAPPQSRRADPGEVQGPQEAQCRGRRVEEHGSQQTTALRERWEMQAGDGGASGSAERAGEEHAAAAAGGAAGTRQEDDGGSGGAAGAAQGHARAQRRGDGGAGGGGRGVGRAGGREGLGGRQRARAAAALPAASRP
eukprot:1802088-Rhodomonas_salina.1